MIRHPQRGVVKAQRMNKKTKRIDQALQRLAEIRSALSRLCGVGARGDLDTLDVSHVQTLEKNLQYLKTGLVSLRDELERGHAVPKAAEDLSLRLQTFMAIVGRIRQHSSHPDLSGKHRCCLTPLDQPLARLHEDIVRFLNEKDEVTTFQKLLKELMDRCQLTTSGLARESGVDDRYIHRLLIGVQRRPGRKVVQQLGEAMIAYTRLITERDVDRLIEAAGHPPLPRRERRNR